jgi:hypothetical protein
MCNDFFLRLSFETFVIPKRTRRDIIGKVHGTSCEVPVVIIRFLETAISSTYFGKTLQYEIL